MNEFLKYRKENLPGSIDLTENINTYNLNKIDLNLFEKMPTTNNPSSQHVFIKPMGIPAQSIQHEFSNKISLASSNKEMKFNQQIKAAESRQSQPLSQKPTLFKSNSIQAHKSSAMNMNG